jgi:hypothetical protein
MEIAEIGQSPEGDSFVSAATDTLELDYLWVGSLKVVVWKEICRACGALFSCFLFPSAYALG